MKSWHITFWLAACVMSVLALIPRFVFLGNTEEVSVALVNKRLVDLTLDSGSALLLGRYPLIIFCLYVMARSEVAAWRFASSKAIPWKKRGEVKIYGDAPWSRTKTTVIIVASIALTLFLATFVSLAFGFAAYIFLLFGSIGGTGFRLIIDDIGVDWNGLLFTWDHVESWTMRYVPPYDDPDNGHGELWYLSVRLTGNQTLECEDVNGIFSQPFTEHAGDKFQSDKGRDSLTQKILSAR